MSYAATAKVWNVLSANVPGFDMFSSPGMTFSNW